MVDVESMFISVTVDLMLSAWFNVCSDGATPAFAFWQRSGFGSFGLLWSAKARMLQQVYWPRNERKQRVPDVNFF